MIEPDDRCCPSGPCLICGVLDPPGHAEVVREYDSPPVGKVCSSHTLWDVVKTGRFYVTIEGPSDD